MFMTSHFIHVRVAVVSVLKLECKMHAFVISKPTLAIASNVCKPQKLRPSSSCGSDDVLLHIKLSPCFFPDRQCPDKVCSRLNDDSQFGNQCNAPRLFIKLFLPVSLVLFCRKSRETLWGATTSLGRNA